MLTIIISDNYVHCIYVLSLTHIIFDMDASLNTRRPITGVEETHIIFDMDASLNKRIFSSV